MEEMEIHKKKKQISPLITLISLLAVMAILCLVMFVFPDKGIKIGSSTMRFPTAVNFFSPPEKEDSLAREKEDLADLFDSSVSLSHIDSNIIRQKLDSLKRLRQGLQLNAKGKFSMNHFFSLLDKCKKNKVRIMHYGDSQIEGDRITSYLRNELQKKFGGYGVGLFPIIQVGRSMSVNIEYSENWKRYPGFGRKDTAVKHMRYGALMAFCRYTPIPKNNTVNESLSYDAFIKIKKPKISYSRTKRYTQISVFLSNSHSNVNYSIIADGISVSEGVIPPNTPFQILKGNFSNTPKEITITFSGADSPDIYGVSLEGNNGIIMDNIPLRGSSGTIFAKQDATLLDNMYAALSPNLIIMEFGGNAIPYIKSDKSAKQYGNWFKSQIKFMKKRNPNAAIIVIGPGDMSVKEKTKYVTYPYLKAVRDAIKDAAVSSGCVFWDMYEVMGGRNSMPKWVNAEPSLAASDYIHFSPKGAKKIAEKFNVKLFDMYDEYKGVKKVKEIDVLENNQIVVIKDSTKLDKIIPSVISQRSKIKIEKSNKINISDLFIEVQIAASNKKILLNSRSFSKLDGIKEFIENGMYKYSVGHFEKISLAEKTRKELRTKGFKGAFLIAFYKGKKISMKEARAIIYGK